MPLWANDWVHPVVIWRQAPDALLSQPCSRRRPARALRRASRRPLSPSSPSSAPHPADPIHVAQFVGLDTLSHIASGWRAERVSTGEIDAKQVEEVALLEKLVGEGHKGRKSGKGLFDCEWRSHGRLLPGGAVRPSEGARARCPRASPTDFASLDTQTRTSSCPLHRVLASVQHDATGKGGVVQCSRRRLAPENLKRSRGGPRVLDFASFWDGCFHGLQDCIASVSSESDCLRESKLSSSSSSPAPAAGLLVRRLSLVTTCLDSQ